MERLDYGSPEGSVVEKPTRSRGGKKRKWREIEALKERQRLRKELEDIDFCNDAGDELLEF
ncbi:hypothetical protein Fbal_0772 [Ferrimonas balearica DSM 9799]|uniref:DUF3545 domain-containing protein n=1 Tax=Ferrimonas balearica (strain DSM 9799 / CCM 4581 / KCTC 23876 / PAT) TaxID=550540 RepID=E1SSE3_FERBD|nr:DUF3545 family protein [Ferrimonas balearica]MBY6018943.1 DUF3545 family protein [Halomonas denitrificans]ADN74983.1 hypothetical protein Fbal_0772 [Ferrimonas balearica DSM 9799]MBW3140786.1 DUF3545 family protein [Ferrimonas balearica]MBW3165237.1 DUF3545 family protein [Ferrimonas balearica]MBY5981552.1 DUF3545 family protein [Ferrimonas balearica]